MVRRPRDISFRQSYPLRMLAATAVTLALAVAVVRWWPAGAPDPGGVPAMERSAEAIQVEEIRPTRQSTDMPPPPPPPQLPIAVVDDVILEQDELDLSDGMLPIDPPTFAQAPEEPGDQADVYEGPRPIRVVEPEYTRAAHRNRVRAEVVVGVRIDAQGRVQETWVQQRFLLGDDGEPAREVESLGYGLEEAAMAAAARCSSRR